ncbi:MAG: MgtC/SapB family protein [Candidatus Nealsonbacteria bacterium]|nr:MgtC/SapB family protein [Candidatus Nealsonbacteria bacterium]
MNIINFQIFFQLIMAVCLGAIIGLEREFKEKGAGLKTYSLVSLGSCVFAITGMALFKSSVAESGFYLGSSTIVQAVAMGIGFIGAGVIFQKESKIEGITTAAGLWVTAAMGMAVGLGLYFISFATTLLMIAIFVGFGFFENKILKEEVKKINKNKKR